MPIVNCIITEHNLWMVLLAVIMVTAGCAVTVRLWERALTATSSRHQWCLLSGVTAGTAIWATHFIAMLGYRVDAAVDFNVPLTIMSILIAIAGSTLGLLLTLARNRALATLCGGAVFGLSVAAMHFVGMFAYRVDGIVEWSAFYVGLAIVFAVGFSILSVHLMLRRDRDAAPGLRRDASVVGGLVTAIVLLHFTGMEAFQVTALPGASAGADSDAFYAMAMAIALAAMLIVFTGFCTQLIDRRLRMASANELHHLAHHDALTDTANRRAFTETLGAFCAAETAAGHRFVLMMIDLDRFKPINDTLGHSVGDVVLTRIARRFKKTLPQGATLARLGGDEFAVICDQTAAAACNARSLANDLIEVASRPVLINGHVIETGASVGLAYAPGDGRDAETLTRNADIALYEAKRDGRATVHAFTPEMAEAIQARRTLELDLRRAVVREEFTVHYQPLVNAATGRFAGAEALVRWNHPERGMQSPASFIPLAEDLGLIGEIGLWVLREACQAAARWPKEYKIAVNLSTVQIMDRRLVANVRAVLDETGLTPSRLEFEVTETAILNNDKLAFEILSELKALGIGLSLDDFGTGYSSLSYLHRFPIDRLKIDRSFIQRIPEDEGGMSIVRAIAQLGTSLGLTITAEGIETEAQQSFSREHGCESLQGFLFSKPVAEAELLRLFGGPGVEFQAA